MRILVTFVAALAIFSGPIWAEEVVGDPARGKQRFEDPLACGACHGLDAKGAVGPNIRQVTLEQAVYAMQQFPDMINWSYNFPELFEEQSLRDIVAYLGTLERDPQLPPVVE